MPELHCNVCISHRNNVVEGMERTNGYDRLFDYIIDAETAFSQGIGDIAELDSQQS